MQENLVLSILQSGNHRIGKSAGSLGISLSIIYTKTKHYRPQNTNNIPLLLKLKVYKVISIRQQIV